MSDYETLMTEDEYHAGVDPVLEEAQKQIRCYDFWTERERAILARYYHRVPASVIAKRLGRSIPAVYMAAVRYGLANHKEL